MKRTSLVLLLFTALVLISGCGYSLSARGAGLINERKVAVSMFANRTYQPGIEGQLRLALVNELAARGSRVETGGADLVITGEIESLLIDTSAFSAADTAMLYRIAMTVQMQLAETSSGKILWKSSETLKQEYPAGADIALQRNARDAALTSLCNRMARTVINRMNQTF